MARLAAGAAILFLVGCGGSDALVSPGAGSAGGGTPATLTDISLSQTDVHIPVGVMTAFAVTGTRADGTTVDVTQQAQAASSNPTVATVQHGQGSQIQIYAMSQGTSTITVTVGALAKTCAVTVTPR